jgi:hypothetical protein
MVLYELAWRGLRSRHLMGLCFNHHSEASSHVIDVSAVPPIGSLLPK